MSKKILITGGAGFIGSHLAEKLLRRGKEDEVFVFDNLSTGNQDNIDYIKNKEEYRDRLTFIRGDVLEDKNLLAETIGKVDEIYHLAAAVGVKTVMEKPLESFLINIDGTRNVLELAVASGRKIPVLITSSSEVYGKNEKIPFKEEDDRIYGSAYNTRWGYGLSKGSDEFLGLAYFREKQLPVIIVRLFNVIGPRQSSAYGMVVPRLIKQALGGEPMTVYGDGEQTRCFGGVGNVTNILIDLMNSQKAIGHIFNVGSDEEISINGLAKKIKDLIGSESKIIHVPYVEVYGPDFDDMRHRKPDVSKIKDKSLGVSYGRFSLEDELNQIIEYFRA